MDGHPPHLRLDVLLKLGRADHASARMLTSVPEHKDALAGASEATDVDDAVVAGVCDGFCPRAGLLVVLLGSSHVPRNDTERDRLRVSEVGEFQFGGFQFGQITTGYQRSG